VDTYRCNILVLDIISVFVIENYKACRSVILTNYVASLELNPESTCSAYYG